MKIQREWQTEERKRRERQAAALAAFGLTIRNLGHSGRLGVARDFFKQYTKEVVHAVLTPRQERVLRQRLAGCTYQIIGEDFEVSHSCIWQIEQAAVALILGYLDNQKQIRKGD